MRRIECQDKTKDSGLRNWDGNYWVAMQGGPISVHVPVPGMDLEDLQVVRDVDMNGEPDEGATLVRVILPSSSGLLLLLSSSRWCD